MALSPDEYRTLAPTGTQDTQILESADKWEAVIDAEMKTGTIGSVYKGNVSVSISFHKISKNNTDLPVMKYRVMSELKRRYIAVGWEVERYTTNVLVLKKSNTEQ